MTNGSVETAAEIELDMDALKWGDIRRFQKLSESDPRAAGDFFNDLLNRVCPGMDDLPYLQAAKVVTRFRRLLEDSISGKDESTAPSLPASGAGIPDTTVT